MFYHRKRILIAIIFTLFTVSILFTPIVSAWTTPPPPSLININPSGNEGDWYVGATPPNYDPQKPLLVFVQGLGGKASDWWGPTVYHGNNDMYAYAYNYGYRTAFVNFRDADGNKGNMWLNGSVLRNLLPQICSYFGMSKVNLICHSKGGIDSQSAIVHYGAYPYVNKVFTLSTPHWGSQLADLSYSWYSWWLGALLGQHDDGTYVLQTGYMSYFRSITDNRSENNTITYYTSAGTNWGPLFSALYCGGLYLSAYDSNDGLVTVTSAHNPRATHIYTGDFDHDSIRIGSNVWWFVEPQIRNYSSLMNISTAAPSETTLSGIQKTTSNYLIQGGPIDKSQQIKIPVDSSSKTVSFDVLVADSEVQVEVLSPSGIPFKPNSRYQDQDYFSGATHIVTSVSNPETGRWTINLNSSRNNAFLLITWFDSEIKPILSSGKSHIKSGDILDLNVKFNESMGKKVKQSAVSANLCKVIARGKLKKISDTTFSKKQDQFSHQLPMTVEPGLYNINLDINGVLDDGSPYVRSIVYSIVVDSDTENGVDYLKKIKPLKE